MAAAQQRGLRALVGFALGAITALLLLEQPRPARADSAWLTGQPLEDALSQKTTVVWSNIPVRAAVAGLCQSQKVALVLDRRIDPDRKIELSLDEVTLSEALNRIAAELKSATTMLGPVAYFGPAETAGKLRQVAALRRLDAAKLPASSRAAWARTEPWKWEDLAAPRDLLSALARESGLKIEGMERVPADLWARADLPPLTLPERLTLLLAQFDLTYEPSADGKSIRLVTLPDQATLDRAASITAPAQQIERPGHRTITTPGKKVYSLQVELPVGQLLQSLGPRMGMEIHVDKDGIAAAGKSVDTKVKIDVKDVGAEELLRAVLEPAGLTFTRKGNAVDVHPKL